MGNIGSHVDLTSGWPGHQADIEADGASRSENWSDGDFAPAMPHPPLTATQVSIDSTARRPVATTTSAVASRLDRHRGGGHPPPPATPPCVRVRTRRFETVTLTFLEQRRKSQRFEVCLGKPYVEGLGEREIPGATATASHIGRQLWTHPQLKQCRPTTAGCFPLPP